MKRNIVHKLPPYMTEFYWPDKNYWQKIFNIMIKHKFGLPDQLRDFQLFFRMMNSQDTKIVNAPYGFYYLTNVNVDMFVAVGHCFFFDNKVIGRAADLNKVSKYGLYKYYLKRIETYLPVKNKSARYLVKKAGYIYEGTLKKRILYNGFLEDIDVFAFFG